MISKIGGKVTAFLICRIKNHAKSHANARKQSCNPLHNSFKV